MDAIRKKMQSLKGETESLYATIRRFEDQTKEYQRVADQVILNSHLRLNQCCRTAREKKKIFKSRKEEQQKIFKK
jgi:hypothetical protein